VTCQLTAPTTSPSFHNVSSHLSFFFPFPCFISKNGIFRTACRCDDEGNCLSQPVQPGTDLNICIFAQPNLEILSIESLRIVQEDLVLSVQTTGNQTGVVLSQCTGKLYIVSTTLPPAFFDPGRPNFISVEGSALAQIAAVDLRKLRGLQLVQENTKTVEMSFGAEIALEQDRIPLQVFQNERGEEGNGGGIKIVAWLLPLILLLLCCMCICFACRRRRKEVLTKADVY
jgi:hypothetical protein